MKSRFSNASVLHGLSLPLCSLVLASLFWGCNRGEETAEKAGVPLGINTNPSAGQREPQVQPLPQTAEKIQSEDQIDYAALDRKIKSAQALAGKGDFEKAASILTQVAKEPTSESVTLFLQAFDWFLRGRNLEMAESVCRQAIAQDPGDPNAQRALAQLLNAEGRRYEAREHVIELIRLGAVSPREVLSLIDLSGPFDLVSFGEVVGAGSGSLLDLGKARRLFVADGKPNEALKVLDQLAGFKKYPAVAALRGRILAEQMKLDELVLWSEELPPEIQEHPEYWLAIGLWCAHEERDQEAVRALAESIILDPTNRRAVRALAATFGRLGDTQSAKKSQKVLGILDSIFREASSADAAQSMRIGTELQQLQRLWESVVWFRNSFEMGGVLEQQADQLNERVTQVREWESRINPEERGKIQIEKNFGFSPSQYPLVQTADLVALSHSETDIGGGKNLEPQAGDRQVRFRDVSESLNFITTFVSEYPSEKVDFWLYQANGGGLGAFDYDLDGDCDLYVVQTGGDPRVSNSSVANQLFRNLDGTSLLDISVASSSEDRGYGQGVCAADLNQDGWPDLIIANIGRNAIFLNQGDGSFRRATADLLPDATTAWTSSVAVGDLDGDHLPELIEIDYLDDPQIFEKKCIGKQLECTPQRFRAAIDHFYSVKDDGTLKPWNGASLNEEKPNYGFGAILGNIDGAAGNDVFISNDGDVNHLWRSSLPQQALGAEESVQSGSRFRLTEAGAIAGCSIGVGGLSQACMGIAAGDFDRNGMLDLLITNFYNEPLNLFLQMSPGLFVDEALKLGLDQTARGVLGFGTQAADFDNDGWLDVAVGNGHLYDARYADIPFRMQSQVFRGSQRGFVLQDASQVGEYWEREHLARTMAMFDLDSDGRMDLVANHLDQPISILRNESEMGNWLQMKLIGVRSERDAVGAKVVIKCGEESWTSWVTSGDGYMCTNQQVLHFGIGDHRVIDDLQIQWPTGQIQSFEKCPVNQCLIVIEGEGLHTY